MKKIIKYCLYLLGAFVAFLVAMNLFVPVYIYDEPVPFHGDYLLNPYQDIDSTYWKCCNFHGHTRQYGGVTNGRNNGNAVYDSMYRLFGYDHVGISDYNMVNPYENGKDPGYIPGYEHGYNVWKTHQVCLGTKKVRRIDYFFYQTLSHKQHMLNKLGEQNRVVAVAHPSFVDGSYNVRDMKYLSNYKLLEVLNGFVNSPEHWDMALSNGHLVYLIADDDTHDVLKVNDIALRITYLNAKNNAADELYDALLAGKAVGIDFDLDRQEAMDHKVERFKRDIPYLYCARLDSADFYVSVSKPIRKADFIGQGGIILKEEEYKKEDTVTNVFYSIQPSDQYVRTVLTFFDGTTMWLNPVTRHDSEVIVKQRLDHISYLWTAALWMIYIGILILSYYGYIQCKKSKRRSSSMD
ncbi:MAG: hypothetical protein II662_01050 [Bacteroidales bacterium]|nr:hypothetical protein [Bacteroidales bacterium]